jgi:diaminohydroxyphosphoribosylaminopyrimidine deaminase/5-amino-6-(5-phosphoribosylamino)uracil reductase
LAGKEIGPNPRVGAVLVYKDTIIGEGYHQYLGGPHAEVNCIESVVPENKPLIPLSTLYISLEPCCHQGRTPPCTSLILASNIKTVVISVPDKSEKVKGKGIQILKESGVNVTTGVLEKEGNLLVAPFTIRQTENRPYVILKTVKSKDNFIGKKGESVWLSNPYTDILTHKWRSQVDGILVGTETVIHDAPSLTTRNFPGENPKKVIIDRNHRIPYDHKTLHGGDTLFYASYKPRKELISGIQLILDPENELKSLLHQCLSNGIFQVMVEGGSTIISSFYQQGLWDEARVITVDNTLHQGIKSIDINGRLIDQKDIKGDSYMRIQKI